MAGMANQNHLIAMLTMPEQLQVHSGDQRTRGINHLQIATFSAFAYGLTDAMRRKNQHSAIGRIIHLIDKYGALGAQPVDNKTVMYDFMPHIYRRPVNFQRPFYNSDGAINSSAKASGLSQ